MIKKNPHGGHRDRLRKKFDQFGEEPFEEHELIELLLYYVIPQGNTNPTAHHLLDAFDSIYGLFSAAPSSYKNIDGVGDKTARLLKLICVIIHRYLKDQSEKEEGEEHIKVNKVSDSIDYCRKLFIGEEYEKLYMLCLDSNNKVRRHYLLGEGTIDQVPVFTRKVVQDALNRSAVRVILTHNHPKGEAKPSDGDIDVTYAVAHALATIEVPVLDHIIIGEKQEYSFLRSGIMPQVLESVKYSLEQREGIVKNWPLSPRP